jgi:hypothetical protein
MQMRSKFTVEYLKTRGAQNSPDNGIEFLRSLLVRISCQTNFAHLNRSLHSPPEATVPHDCGKINFQHMHCSQILTYHHQRAKK